MKKAIKYVSVLTIIIALLGCVGFADTNVRYYTNQEISEVNQSRLDAEYANDNHTKNVKDTDKKSNDGVIKTADSFYAEWPVSYADNQTITKFDAFEVGIASFDTRGETTPSKLTITYNQAQEVNWTISGTASGSAEFDLLKAKVTATLAITVERSSTTTTGIGASIEKTIDPNRYGYVKIYAHGVYTGGVMKYQWQDVAGGSGYKYKTISSKLPLNKYETFNIHFGPVVYL